jgi:Leucine-rich repeat (LRR) protein
MNPIDNIVESIEKLPNLETLFISGLILSNSEKEQIRMLLPNCEIWGLGIQNIEEKDELSKVILILLLLASAYPLLKFAHVVWRDLSGKFFHHR